MAKVLYFDIETSPNLGYTWEKYEQNVLSFVQESYMLSYAYAWNDEPVHVRSLPDFDGYTAERTNDRDLVHTLWLLFNEADVIVAHNGKKFDLRYSNGRFLFHSFEPPTRYQVIDTLQLARANFKLNSNKLDDLAKVLKLGGKVNTGGFDLWLGCMAGQEQAWTKMRKYNKHDVLLLREVYNKLHAWGKHPNLNVIDGVDTPSCSHCQSTKVWKIGTEAYGQQLRQRWRCAACGTNLYTNLKGTLPLR